MNNLFDRIHFFLNMLFKQILIIFCFFDRVNINENEKIVSYVNSITWSYPPLSFDSFSSFNSLKIFSISLIHLGIELVSNSLKSNVIRILSFSIQSFSRITFLEIDPIYMIICYCLSDVQSWSFIYSFRIIFSFITILVSVSYLTEMVFSLFSRVHVYDTTVILVPESISPSLVVVLSFVSRTVIKRVIKVSNPNFSSFSRLSRFPRRRRL